MLDDKSSPGLWNFYVKISATGGTITYFGPYSIKLECASGTPPDLTKHDDLKITEPQTISKTQQFLIG